MEFLMATIKKLDARLRAGAGKGAARAERRAGRVPAVIYGDGQAPVTISLDYKEANKLIYAGHFLTTRFELNVDGTVVKVIPRDYQLHPVKDTPLHIDFLRLGANTRLKVEVPVHVLNQDTCPGLKAGGSLEIIEHSVELSCPADAIPDSVDVDLSKLNVGSVVHLSDIQLPEGVKSASNTSVTLVTISAPAGGDSADAS
jgi:large subunit ribosomal protein L25